MAQYDDAFVHIVSADETAASNALVSKGAIRIHKLVLDGPADGTNAVSALVYNAATPTGSVMASIATSEVITGKFERYTQQDFNPPIRFGTGLSVDLTGTGAVLRVYYSR